MPSDDAQLLQVIGEVSAEAFAAEAALAQAGRAPWTGSPAARGRAAHGSAWIDAEVAVTQAQLVIIAARAARYDHHLRRARRLRGVRTAGTGPPLAQCARTLSVAQPAGLQGAHPRRLHSSTARTRCRTWRRWAAGDRATSPRVGPVEPHRTAPAGTRCTPTVTPRPHPRCPRCSTTTRTCSRTPAPPWRSPVAQVRRRCGYWPRGLDVHGVDVSAVAIVRAQALAERAGVAARFEVVDLDEGLPAGDPVDLLLCHKFRDPTRYPQMSARLKPGGLLAPSVCSARSAPHPGGSRPPPRNFAPHSPRSWRSPRGRATVRPSCSPGIADRGPRAVATDQRVVPALS